MRIEVRIPSERIADFMISALEAPPAFGARYWLHDIRLVAPEKTAEEPWYSDPRLYEGEFTVIVQTDDPGAKIRKRIPGMKLDGGSYERRLREHDFQRGVETMARKYPSRFGDLLSEYRSDAPCAEEWLQCVVFGEVAFG